MLQYSEDIKCKLLAGSPLIVNGITIHRVTIAKIADIGFDVFFNAIGMLMMTPADVVSKFVDTPSIRNVFDLMAIMKYADESVFDEYNRVFTLIFGESINYIDQEGAHLANSGMVLNSSNIVDIIAAIRMRNGMYSEDGNDDYYENPSNDNVKRLLERRKKMRKKVASMKKHRGGGIEYSDVLSIYSSLIGQSPSEVAEKYDLYQLSNQLQRYQMHEQYDIQIQSMLHGAKIDDDDFKHYMRQMGKDSSDE